jgi:hypothetical protein
MKLILLILLISANCYSQNTSWTSDSVLLANHYNNIADQKEEENAYPLSLNPLKTLYSLYKIIFSEQISAHCDYTPSCSMFGHQAVKDFGFLKGVFLALDRFSRCTGNSDLEYPYYLINQDNGKVYDPPANYKFGD